LTLIADNRIETVLARGGGSGQNGNGINVFNHGGRFAVVQGNVIPNLAAKRPAGTDPNDGAGIGIGVEADSAVTGNVIENAPSVGISIGYGKHLRDVTVTGNVVRMAGIGIAVSVAPGAGAAGHCRQPDRRRARWRHRRDGMEEAGDRRSRPAKAPRATPSSPSAATGSDRRVPKCQATDPSG
jgi:putative cofactor-binding repeat protein